MINSKTDHESAEHCCRGWLAIFQANHIPRSNGRWAVVVRLDGEIIAWAAYSPGRGDLDVVLLHGGRHRPTFGHDGTVPGFLRVVREVIIDDMADQHVVMWEGAR